MAGEQPTTNGQAAAPAAPTSGTAKTKRYFRSNIAGLSIHVAPAKEDEVAPHTVRFTPIFMQRNGDDVKVGFLATSNKTAIARCEDDANITEITQDEYDEVMAKVEDPDEPNVKRASL